MSANAFASKPTAPQLLAKNVSSHYEAFEKTFLVAATALFTTTPVELTPALQEALYQRVSQQFNNSFPSTIERKDVFDLHMSELLKTFEAVYVEHGVKEGRKEFTDLLATLPHLQASSFFQDTLRLPPFEPNAQFNYYLSELHKPLALEISDGSKPTHTSYVEAYGHLLLYASKRSNSLFVGKYLFNGIPDHARLEAARKFFVDRHVFWVKDEVEIELPTGPGNTKVSHALSKSIAAVDTQLPFTHYGVLKTDHVLSAEDKRFI